MVEINRQMISAFGGDEFSSQNNLLNPNTLSYALDSIQGDIFGVEIFPTTTEKAASLAWHIIKGHVFYDGNKRTGIEAARLFLELNGINLEITDEIINVACEIASGRMNIDE